MDRVAETKSGCDCDRKVYKCTYKYSRLFLLGDESHFQQVYLVDLEVCWVKVQRNKKCCPAKCRERYTDVH